MVIRVSSEYRRESVNRGNRCFQFVGRDSQELIAFSIPSRNCRKPRIQSIAKDRDFVISGVQYLLVYTEISEHVHFSNQPANPRSDGVMHKQTQYQGQEGAYRSDGQQPQTWRLGPMQHLAICDVRVLGIDVTQGSDGLPSFRRLRTDLVG